MADEQEISAEAVDLDKARDERVFPVAKDILAYMADMMIPQNGEETNYGPLVIKMQKRALEADLNLTTDNPYVFQLLLGVVSGLNSTVLEANTVPIDDTRFGAITKKVLAIVSSADIPLGNFTPDEVKVQFAPVKEKINILFAEEKLSWMEVKYVMDSLLAAFKEVEQIYSINVDKSLQRAEAKAMGVEDMSDITMGKLNDYLLS